MIAIQFYLENSNILFIYESNDNFFFEYFKLIHYLNHDLLDFRCNEFVNGKTVES